MEVKITYTANNVLGANISDPNKPNYQDVKGHLTSGKRSFFINFHECFSSEDRICYIYRSMSYFAVTSPTFPGRVLLEGRMTTKKKVFSHLLITNLPPGFEITDENARKELEEAVKIVLDSGSRSHPVWGVTVADNKVLFIYRKNPTFRLEAEIIYSEQEVPYHVPAKPKNGGYNPESYLKHYKI